MHSYIKPLKDSFLVLANPERAAGAKAYLKNQFEFFGLTMPERRIVFKDHMKQRGLVSLTELEIITRELWNLPQREFQYCAIELLVFHKKLWEALLIDLFEYCIVSKSWWDTVDFLCSKCVGPYFKAFPDNRKEITSRWNRSANIWLQRSSLLSQLGYKKDTDTNLLGEYIIHLSESKEFFVQKAIGWMLREYAKVDAEWVEHFVANNPLPKLSKREALKHLKK